MNDFIVPKELVTKLKFSLDINFKEALVKFNDDEIDLYNFCENWFNKLLNNYGYYKVDIAQYLGVFPLQVNKKFKKVYFNIDHIKPSTWEDWFIEDTDINMKCTSLIFEEKGV